LSRLGALAPVYLSVFLYVAGSSALQILVPVYLNRHAHFGPAAVGAIVSAYAIASLAARLPVGLMYSARLGGVFLVAGGALSAVAFALVPFVHGSLAFTLLMVLNGVGWSVATTAQLAVLVARPPGGASTAAAMGWFSGATGLGNALAGVMGGGLADWLGLRTTFLALAVTPLLGSLLMMRQIATATALAAERPPQHDRPSILQALVRMPIAVWIGVLVMFFINGLNAVTNTFQPLLALGAGLSLTQIGALSSIRSWASSSSRFGSGPIFSRWSPASLTMPLVILGTLSTALIPSVIGSFLLQVPLFVLAGLSRGLLRVTGSADAFDSIGDDDRTRGMTSAFLYGGLDLGKIVLPVAGGVIAGAWGIANMLRVVPVGLLAVYLALTLLARRRVEAATRASAPSSARS
jgi:MFS family permease